MNADEGATRVRVASESEATRSVVEASRFSREVGLDAVDAQAVATAVSELARNILKYAGSGEILFQRANCGNSRGIIVTARDSGPGIENIEAAMQDHFSSSGTLGLGLPGVRRMMDEFNIESVPGKSTTVSCLKWDLEPRGGGQFLNHSKRCGTNKADLARPDRAGLELDYASCGRPYRGEHVSGDIALFEQHEHLLMFAVIDGLGHGQDAHQVACRARDFLKTYWSEDVVGILQRLHGELRGSLGAVAGLAVIDTLTGKVKYAGIGNITYRLFGPRNARLVSMAGTLGQQIRTPQLQEHTLAEDDVVVMYSDGIKDRFDLADYPQLQYQSAETVARNIVERFGKHHDDATCITLRIRQ